MKCSNCCACIWRWLLVALIVQLARQKSFISATQNFTHFFIWNILCVNPWFWAQIFPSFLDSFEARLKPYLGLAPKWYGGKGGLGVCLLARVYVERPVRLRAAPTGSVLEVPRACANIHPVPFSGVSIVFIVEWNNDKRSLEFNCVFALSLTFFCNVYSAVSSHSE